MEPGPGWKPGVACNEHQGRELKTSTISFQKPILHNMHQTTTSNKTKHCFRSRTSYRPNAFSPAILNPHRFSKLFAPSRYRKKGFFWTPKTLAKTGPATEGLPSSRTCVAINVRRVWRTSACGAAKPWKSSGVENFCRVRAETIQTLAIFRPRTKILPTKRPPFWGPETDPKMEATHSVSI